MTFTQTVSLIVTVAASGVAGVSVTLYWLRRRARGGRRGEPRASRALPTGVASSRYGSNEDPEPPPPMDYDAATAAWLARLFLRDVHVDAGKPPFGVGSGPRSVRPDVPPAEEPPSTRATPPPPAPLVAPVPPASAESAPWADPDANDIIDAIRAGACDPRVRELKPYYSNNWSWGAVRPNTHRNSIILHVKDRDGRHKALKVYFENSAGREVGYKRIDALRRQNDPLGAHLCPGEYVIGAVRPRGQPIDALIMNWVEGETLNKYVRKIVGDRQKLLALATAWRELVARMLESGYAHGDFCPSNVLVLQEERSIRLVLIDNDSFSWDEHRGELEQMVGHDACQPPSRMSNPSRFADVKIVDHCSSLVMYLGIFSYTVAGHNGRVEAPLPDDPGIVFRREDLEKPAESALFQWLCGLPGDEYKWLRDAATTLKHFLETDADPYDLPPLKDVLRGNFSHET